MGSVRSIVRSGIRRDGPMAAELDEELDKWLTKKGFTEAWKLAPVLAEAGVFVPQLEPFLAAVPLKLQPLALQDLLETVSQDTAVDSVILASERIFRIVAAVKDCSYMDRQPLQEVDITSAIDNVQMMFQPRLKHVLVKKNNIPPVLPACMASAVS
jgi:hypothetical protein